MGVGKQLSTDSSCFSMSTERRHYLPFIPDNHVEASDTAGGSGKWYFPQSKGQAGL